MCCLCATVVLMEVSVAEAAEVLGVSPQRVRTLIHDGRLRARQVAGRWLVDGASLPRAPRRSRPMSPRGAWQILEDSQPVDLTPEAAYRWRARRQRLARDPEPERLLMSWVASRASRVVFESRDPESVLDDPRVIRAGLSDHRAGMAGGGVAEGYVRDDDLKPLQRVYLLRPGGVGSNVVLHVSPHVPEEPVPLLVLAADLAEHDGPRELGRARELIREALAA